MQMACQQAKRNQKIVITFNNNGLDEYYGAAGRYETIC
jgi:hypothetical protein